MPHPQYRKRPARPLEQLRYFVDRNGRQHFNFRQQVWLDPTVPMAYTRVPSIALTTLAVNLLAQALRQRASDLKRGSRLERDSLLAIGQSTRCALTLARQFSEECLLGAPDEGWVMPRATIRAWLSARLRSATSRRWRSCNGGWPGAPFQRRPIEPTGFRR
jgi:hypothetical protein